MSCDVPLMVPLPGVESGQLRVAGFLNIRKVDFTGQYAGSEKCLDMEVETLPVDPPAITVKSGSSQVPATYSWLTLEAGIWTTQVPRRSVGRIHIPQTAMLPIAMSRQGPARWGWVIQPEDVEVVERARAGQPATPLYFQVEIRGLAKIVGAAGDAGIAALRGECVQLVIEHSQWERLVRRLEYDLPPSHVSLAGLSALDHPSWAKATKMLERARNHHRSGEDYDALRVCLSAFEALVTAPYNPASWKRLLTALPAQKADAIAGLLSGAATFGNRIGHHRSRAERDASGDLPQMPLEHWEADLILGAAQFLLTYAVRLRLAGVLEEPSAAHAQASSAASKTVTANSA